ncbi:hypothetical protein IQ230_19225 [Gloeocapsopsis crepidinum LEGE 06123]|uniref:Glycosyltransferase RgtA/B/C/D-like domain-containing protein n=1 Tax=Gloeocapsopsis crepidinum LEGE 06123 TaxID=588587 RepID=A0ABR9UWS6_9CHRO|nr:glycosyltransferase family 39 protein [Gloeocapsopsis crepidinum]MBE9192440.1 hypothetical protein [Gloeocapsopsis crepidinum LEGE 06123]
MQPYPRLHVLTLLIWIAIGSVLRFANLAAKPPWNDEFATVVFSLGNSFRTVPTDKIISLETLLQPLQPNPDAGISDVIQHLMAESTHPPIYFVLTHLWMKLFPTVDGLASFWAARSLSALFGVAAIVAIFGLAYVAFRSLPVAQIVAAMMAVSPYGIYQAQEARHYTLAILLVIASLCCLVIAIRNIQNYKYLSIGLAFFWIFINALGIAIHYFFIFNILAVVLVLISFWLTDIYKWLQLKTENKYSRLPLRNQLVYWYRIYAVVISAFISSVVWLPIWRSVPENKVTQWIFDDNSLNLLKSLSQFIAWLITMFVLLPIEGVNVQLMLLSGSILIGFTVWLIPIIIKGIKLQNKNPKIQLEFQVLLRYLWVAIALLFTITFSFNADLTIAARYQFFYFPTVLLLMAAALATTWNTYEYLDFQESVERTHQRKLVYPLNLKGKTPVILLLLLGLLGSLTVISNFAYQKPDRPDLLAPIINEISQPSTLIATTYFTHEQIGEMMGLALELKHRYHLTHKSSENFPSFLLAHLDSNSQPINTLKETLAQLPKPLTLWVINFFPTAEPKIEGCHIDPKTRDKMNGYKYRIYYCL